MLTKILFLSVILVIAVNLIFTLGHSNIQASAALTQAVSKPYTTTTLTSSANPSIIGKPITFTATVSPSTATGTMIFIIDGKVQPAVTISGGKATLSTSTLSIGSHTILAQYPGNAIIIGSTSSALIQKINQVTTTYVQSSPNPSTFGQPITFTATVSPSTATGTVTFTIDGKVQPAVTISGGKATLSTSTLLVGSHSITVQYSGDTIDASSISSALTQTVKQAITTTTLSSNASPSIVGQSVTFTATVSPSTATGTVTFTIDGKVQPAVTISAGKATLSTSALSIGSHTLSAQYSGDSNFIKSAGTSNTSNTLAQTINPFSTITIISSQQNPITTGQSVTFTATVSPGTATGTLTFTIDGLSQPAVPLSNGHASFYAGILSTGSHTILAQYSGDANDAISTSNKITQIVNQASTITTVSSSVNPSLVGQSVTFTATVSPGTATGTVQFSIDGKPSGNPITLSGGNATFSTSSLSVGLHAISAQYSGDSNFINSTSTEMQTVNQAYTVSLSDIITINDTVKTKHRTPVNGTLLIETIQSPSNSFVRGASYSVTPNPLTGSGILNVTDGSSGDGDILHNGVIIISDVPRGTYDIEQVEIPSGFISLVNSTTAHINHHHSNETAVFNILPARINIAYLTNTAVTAPSLDNSTFNNMTASSAKIVSNTNSTTITNIDQVPQIVVAGSANATAINQAINSTSSISIDTSLIPLDNGSHVMDTFNLDNYSLPNSTKLVAVIPTIVANVSGTTGSIIATPPLSETIPGQKMIIPVPDSLIPDYGGLKEMDVQSSPTINSTSSNSTNWFVAEVENQIPDSIGSAGIGNATNSTTTNSTVLFISIQHPYEDHSQGHSVNWSNVTSFAVPPTLTIIVNKVNDSSIQQDSEGCPFIQPYTRVSGIWTTSGVTELSSKSISPDKCMITIQSHHFSKFAFSLMNLGSVMTSVGLFGSGSVSTGITGSSNVAIAISQSSTTLTSSVNPSIVGQLVTFTATVSPSTATGTVTFTIDGKVQPAVTISGGKATFSTSAFSVGSHAISAQYSGNANTATSTSNSITQTVKQASTQISLLSSAIPSSFGQSVTIRAIVAPISPSTGTPTGTITFTVDGKAQPNITLSGGQANFAISTLSIGSHTITVQYSGDSNFVKSTGSGIQTVTQATTTTTLSSSTITSTFGQLVTFTATVSPSTATGTVTFTIDGKVQPAVTISVGKATFSTSAFSVGSHAISAQYSGNANNAASSSNKITQTVTQKK